jgi:glycosyltransferase involved in cell wall biosynthesis
MTLRVAAFDGRAGEVLRQPIPGESATTRSDIGPVPLRAARIALFVPRLVAGGAEHVMLTLAGGFVQRGHAVDLVAVKAEGVLLSRVPDGVRLIELGTRRVVESVPALMRYLRKERPSALLSTLNTANAVAVAAAKLARRGTRVVIRQADHFSRSLEQRQYASTAFLRPLVRLAYPRADAVIAVSCGVADDLAMRLSIPRVRIHVVPNPIVTTDLLHLSHCPVDHPWFAAGAEPVILGAGRLTGQKRFDLLIRAFARVRQRRACRLVILGEGDERPALEALVQELGLGQVVSLPGFAENPFAYMAKARLFVLSSAWEGLPGALIQALACGIAVVATDCDSGPREILQGGTFGRLVPVGDEPALADAICATLEEPPAHSAAQAYLPYGESTAVDAYLRILKGAI